MDTKGNLKCEYCYYSEMIDGVLYCHHCQRDVEFKESCDNFVNNFRLKEIWDSAKEFLRMDK